MKNLIIILLLMFPVPVFSQTKNDYNDAMGKLIKYCNKGQLDSINSILTNHTWDEMSLRLVKKTHGKIKSYKYLLIDSTDIDVYSRPTAYFAGVSTKKWFRSKVNAMCIALSNENKITSMRFMTKSPHSDSLLSKYYYKYSN